MNGPAQTPAEKPGDPASEDKSAETAAAQPVAAAAQPVPAAAQPVAAAAPKKPRKWLRRLGYAALVLVVSGLGLWIAVNRIPWLGPKIADGIRAVVGPGPVAWLEDTLYGIQDDVNVWQHGEDAPTTLWEGEAQAAEDAQNLSVAPPRWLPAAFAAPYEKVSTPSDGKWIPIKDPARPEADAPMYKAMVHPDERRPFAVLAVVAIDVKALALHLVAGTTEPTSAKVPLAQRPGIIAKDDRDLLVAAFNGGFKTTHGQYGMMLDGVEYLPPRDFACTLAKYADGSFRIATFSDMKDEKDKMTFYRQTPPCLAENGELHKLLNYNEYAKGWGATVSGDTVIRRSSVGLSQDGKTLFYGIGDAMTAQSIGRGMLAAGAHAVAELDVNFSYPRFLLYQVNEGMPPSVASALIPHIEYQRFEYVSQSAARDFFYLTRLPQPTGSL